MYSKALVDRNLLLVRRQDTNGNVKSCSIHDLLRDLCVKKARQDRLFFVKNWQAHKDITSSLRRASAHPSSHLRDIYTSMESMRLARSFLFVGSTSWTILSDLVFELRLLRALDTLEIIFGQFPLEVLQLVNLRYLALAAYSNYSHSNFPPSINLLQNLQILIFRQLSGYVSVEGAYEIFYMRSLRRIKFKEQYFEYDFRGKSLPLLQNLRPVSGIIVETGFGKVLESAPKLNKLGIFGSHGCKIDLSGLSKLKTLKCSSDLSASIRSFVSSVIFPRSLRKLTLKECEILPECMKNIGTLPNLEELKLQNSTYEKPTWEPMEGEFCKLEYLLPDKLNLVNLVAKETHFPKLRHLVIRGCDALEEIPLDVGEISTLEIIEVHESSPSVAASARKIYEKQLDLGNDGLQVGIIGSSNQ